MSEIEAKLNKPIVHSQILTDPSSIIAAIPLVNEIEGIHKHFRYKL